mmetsp:Transcript_26096/g.71888  ORF Transcript_26096/g.71888 Transcript_26096/m.71888 type:complete len:287 (+) Transcript_26096:102-962(+)
MTHNLLLHLFFGAIAALRCADTAKALSLDGTRTNIRRILFRRSNESNDATTNPRIIRSASTISTPLMPSTQYIPDGLTESQYQQIKKEESKAEANKDYGAWGPRFQRDKERPDGDWMLQPQLWTRGTVVDPRQQQQQQFGDQTLDTDRIYTKRGLLLKRFLPMLVVMMILVESSSLWSLALGQSWTTTAATTENSRRMISKILRQWLAQTTVMTLLSSQLVSTITSKVIWMKGGAALLGTPILIQSCRCLEQRLGWKRRNSLVTIASVALVCPLVAIVAMIRLSAA